MTAVNPINIFDKLSKEDCRIFREMIVDEMFYIDTEFAHSSDRAIKEAITESIDELSRGFPQLSKSEIRGYMGGVISRRVAL
jgi:hypothetical protein